MNKVLAQLRRGVVPLAAVAVTAVVTFAGTTNAAAAPSGQIRYAGSPTAVPGSYLVVFKDGSVSTTAVSANASRLTGRFGGSSVRTWNSAVRGYEFAGSATAAARIAADPAVAYVEQNQYFTASATQTGATWGIDRIDQRALPLSTTYTYSTTASNVHAYVIDTGILTTHSQFGGRASSGYDFVDNDSNATDCNGHGTHVAGTIGGSTYGVAKGVLLVGVRVLNCSGSGTTAGVVSGINWVTSNAIKPAVANMSLGGGASTTLDNAVAASITSGVTYAIAAGNNGLNACNYSPARVGTAITVGATSSTDAKASWSNYGSCLDIFAPGVSITSSWYSSTTATNTISGTSMATPHVAGAAALILADNTAYTPAQVAAALIANATTGVVTSAGTNSPNRLLFVS
ncbi:subtilisin family serine protease [Hamadaea flava]|uniref:S8 family peptidase n=1 Tax=Hamadaea flava TaxID=1742688 RepID=A0ABV8LL00_9ACTN|nr:subtilisin family serine protease [Hamadaea flava]